jgi:hypothetical protein
VAGAIHARSPYDDRRYCSRDTQGEQLQLKP